MDVITGDTLKQFVLEHCKPQRVRAKVQKGFYKVVKPMHVFKKVHVGTDSRNTQAIANLIIPVGALIYAEDVPIYFADANDYDYRKMRASEAKVVSIVSCKNQIPANEGFSGSGSSFKYHSGKTVKPTYPFSKKAAQCESGIHFFVNLRDALKW